jgi:hypothetical protein
VEKPRKTPCEMWKNLGKYGKILGKYLKQKWNRGKS